MSYMSSDVALGVATATFSALDSVPESVMVQYWKMATSRKNTELMGIIAGHKDLPESLEDSLLNRAEVGVRASFLIKLSKESKEKKRFENLMVTEIRSGVLALVVCSAEKKFSSKVNAHLVSMLKEKPTKVLAEAVLKNDVMGNLLHLEAFKCLVTLPNVDVSTELFVNRLSVWTSNEVELLNLLSLSDSAFGEHVAATLLSSSDISDKVRISALEKSLGKWVMGKSLDQYVTFSVARLCVLGLLRNEGLGSEVLNLIDTYHQNGTEPDIVKAIKSSDYTSYNSKISNLEDNIKSCAAVKGDLAAVELLTELNSAKCFEVLFKNPSISSELKCKIISKYATFDDEGCYNFLLKEKITDEIALSFYSVCPYFTTEDGFKLFSDERLGMQLCLIQEGDDSREVAFFSRWVLLQNVVKRVEFNDPILLDVPWSFFEEIASSSWRWSSGDGLEISRKMFKALAMAQEREFLSAAAWEGYGVICEGFKGSVKELLYTCKVV